MLGRADPVDRRTDHFRAVSVRLADEHRIQSVLLGERLNRLGRAQVDGNDAPRAELRLQRALGVDGLVGAVEGAETHVDDAGREVGAVIAGRPHGGGQRNSVRKSGQGHQFNPKFGWLRARSMPRNSASPFSRPMAG